MSQHSGLSTLPRVVCRRCGKLVSQTRFGIMRKHSCPHGRDCDTYSSYKGPIGRTVATHTQACRKCREAHPGAYTGKGD